ncbi:Uncharacterised protein [Yersinia enterocolitica]|nr:Uncharacterised protein [Yersinia enterocolitica]
MLIATKNSLLLLQGSPIPEFHFETDNPSRLITATDRPGRFSSVFLNPNHLVDQRYITGFRIRGSVFKTQQVDWRFFTFAAGSMGRNKTFTFPAHTEKIWRVFDYIAQSMNHGFIGIRANLQQYITVAQASIQ